jgi:gliding motility-associated-like protein
MNFLLKYFGVLSLITFTASFNASLYAQNLCLGSDTTICAGSAITIEVCPNTADTNVVFLNNVTTINLGDDQYSGIIPIGFSFTFYGNTYTQCLISSNGYISFNTNTAGGFSPWNINAAVPNPALPRNTIMGPWQDYNPAAFGSNGIVGYTTIGSAPNRRFVVIYKDMFMFGTQQEGCSAIVLHETSNEIEVFLDEKPVVAWNNGAAIEATHNNPGNAATVVPGRNFPTQWTASLDGQRWTPNGTNNYTVTPIPYRAYVLSNGPTMWQTTTGATINTNTPVLNITPNPTGGSNQIGYFINYSSCAVANLFTSDTTWVTVNNVTASANGIDDICSAGIGEATASGSGGVAPYSFQWNDPNNQTTATATGLFAGTYNVVVTDANGCSANTNVIIGDDPLQLTATTTLVSCPGGNDGTATVSVNPAGPGTTYNWYDAGGQTGATATGLSAGTYHVEVVTDNNCTDTLSVTISEIPAMVITASNIVNATCNSGSDGQATINVTQGTAPYSFNWLTVNGNAATATNLPAGINTVEVTDDNGCIQTFDVTVGEPPALFVANLSDDQVICQGDSVTLFAQGGGGSSAYSFNWTSNGQPFSSGATIDYTTLIDSSEVCVTVTEACGSPPATACLIVSFPEDIIPDVSPSTTGECIPVPVIFTNTTASNEVAMTIWDFGDGNIDTTLQLNTAFNEYTNFGLYDVTMEIISIFGCSYTRTFSELVAGYRHPVASFYLNPEPASVFDPTVQGMNQSSPDAIFFSWSAPGAQPESSNEEFPIFKYPNEEDEYTIFLVVETAFGCRDSVERIARIENEVQLFAPNAFTPDGDSFNDRWRVHISGIDIFDFHLRIFNRWGQLIFESFDPDGEWDGTYGGQKVQDGVYIWTISAADLNTDKKHQFKGFINVLR